MDVDQEPGHVDAPTKLQKDSMLAEDKSRGEHDVKLLRVSQYSVERKLPRSRLAYDPTASCRKRSTTENKSEPLGMALNVQAIEEGPNQKRCPLQRRRLRRNRSSINFFVFMCIVARLVNDGLDDS